MISNKTSKYLQQLLYKKMVGKDSTTKIKTYSNFKKNFDLIGIYLYVEASLFTSMENCLYLIGRKRVNCATYFKDIVLDYDGPHIGLSDDLFLIEVNFTGEENEVFDNFKKSRYTKLYTKSYLLECPWEFFNSKSDMGALAPEELKDDDASKTSFRLKCFSELDERFNGLIYSKDMELDCLVKLDEETYVSREDEAKVLCVAEFPEGDTKVS